MLQEAKNAMPKIMYMIILYATCIDNWDPIKLAGWPFGLFPTYWFRILALIPACVTHKKKSTDNWENNNNHNNNDDDNVAVRNFGSITSAG